MHRKKNHFVLFENRPKILFSTLYESKQNIHSKLIVYKYTRKVHSTPQFYLFDYTCVMPRKKVPPSQIFTFNFL